MWKYTEIIWKTSPINKFYKSGKVSRIKNKILIMECDFCEMEFTRTWQHRPKNTNENIHFCNKSCRMKNQMARDWAKPEYKAMMIEAINDPEAQRKRSESVKKVLSRPEIKKKISEATLRMYEKHPEYKDLQREIMKLANTPEARAKTAITISSPEYKIKISAILKQVHIDHPEIVQKIHATKKKNGSYGKSEIESNFYMHLIDYFGEENVERQCEINGWQIDFYIINLKTYIQFDGVYYHGLNRFLDLIKSSDKKIDKTILGTYERDQKQNKWFPENNINLIRFTDKEFIKAEKEMKIKELIKSKLNLNNIAA